MKKYLFIMAALLVGVAAYAQNAYDVKETWQKTVNVPTSEAPLIEKLFTAWGAEFPGMYVDAFNKYKETGKAKHIEIYEDAYADFKVECAPKNGYIEISTADTMIATENANFSIGDTIIRRNILTAVYWNLKSGNKLFAVSINDDGEIFPECALAFYEYDAAKGTLTPCPKIVKKVMDIIDDDEDTFVVLPKQGKDLKFYDFRTGGMKTIKWNGNGF